MAPVTFDPNAHLPGGGDVEHGEAHMADNKELPVGNASGPSKITRLLLDLGKKTHKKPQHLVGPETVELTKLKDK